jgi:excisionase family DNA binding protein
MYNIARLLPLERQNIMKIDKIDLSTAEIATLLRLHQITIQRLLRTGQLRGYRVGRKWRVPIEALDELRGLGVRRQGRPFINLETNNDCK